MDKAYEIADMHIKKMNPDIWNGEGEKPESFNTKIVTYPINDDFELDVSYEFEDTEWTHYVELRDKESGELLECEHGYGIDARQNMADTISAVCRYRGISL